MTWQALATFTLLCVLLALTPGPDSFLVLRFAMADVRAGVAAAIGSGVATIGWAAAVAFGLAAVLEQSAVAFRAVKVAGGLYLLWLGVSTLVRHRRGGVVGDDELPVRPSVTPRAALRAGFISTSLNPKVGLFVVAVFPQFLGSGGVTFGGTMLLGLIMATVAIVYLASLSFVARKAVDVLHRPQVRDGLERASAGVLTVLGVGILYSAAR
jgi:threonine/homoserine/homoserine lactone efflux protein